MKRYPTGLLLTPHDLYENLTEIETAQKNINMITTRVAQLEIEKTCLLGQLSEANDILRRAKPTSRITIIKMIESYMAASHWKNPKQTMKDQMNGILRLHSNATELVNAYDKEQDTAPWIERIRDSIDYIDSKGQEAKEIYRSEQEDGFAE